MLSTCPYSLPHQVAPTEQEGPRPAQRMAGALAALALVLGSNVGGAFADEGLELPFKEPLVTTPSSKEAKALASKLIANGAQMFGAFWCSHCFDQKEAFGKDAKIPYVECEFGMGAGLRGQRPDRKRGAEDGAEKRPAPAKPPA
jgi:hypothetical protein